MKKNISTIFDNNELGRLTTNGVFSVDIDHNITSWNQAAERITGYTKEEILGKKCFLFSRCDCGKKCRIQNNAIAKPDFNIICEIVAKDGRVIKIKKNIDVMTNQRGEVIGGIASFEDCSEVEKYANKLSDIKQQFNVLANLPDDAIIMIDEDGIIEFWNKAAEDILGYTKDEALGINVVYLLFDEAYTEEFLRGMNHFCRNRENISGRIAELNMKKKDGLTIPVELSMSEVQTENGCKGIGIIRDLVEKKKADQERELMQQQVFQASKLASIGSLAAGVAHEINNPLAIIQAHIDLFKIRFQKENLLDEKIKQNIQSQQTAVERIIRIVNSLNSFARQEYRTLENIDMNHAIKDVLNMLGVMLEKNEIKILLELDDGELKFLANSGKIQQVITNLLTNAKDAMETCKNKQIIIRTFRGKKFINLQITDSGPGMSKEIKKNIFDSFYTTKPAGKGTGLGLSISQAIVSEFRGSIMVQSALGEGTTFHITFPISREKSLPKDIKEENEIKYSKLSGKVLLVEDEVQLRDMYKLYLQTMGLSVDCACDGQTAEQLIQSSRIYDVVLTDLKMPNMNGVELIERINKLAKCKNTKVIAMTGGVDKEENEQILKKYSLELLVKPFSRKQLYQRLAKNLLGYDNTGSG